MDKILESISESLRNRPLAWENGDQASVVDVLYGCYCESIPVVDANKDVDVCKRRAFEWGLRVGVSLSMELSKLLQCG